MGTASGYRFQLSANPGFSSPIIDTILTDSAFIPSAPVAEGAYFWRVKVLSGAAESAWSGPIQINSAVLPIGTALQAAPALDYKILPVPYRRQHKDMRMLDMEGVRSTGQARWDSAHEKDGDWIVGNGEPVIVDALDKAYCVRASIAMAASYYGASLSQDWISYWIFGGGSPEGDLGHGRRVPWSQIGGIASWALGSNPDFHQGIAKIDQYKAWIDAGRPIISDIRNHTRIIAGYLEFQRPGGLQQWLVILDPGFGEVWVPYANESKRVLEEWVAPDPALAAPVSDEDLDHDGVRDTIDDSDGDGLVDFDEYYRFDTDPRNPDKDGDSVPDKTDLYEYMFDRAGKRIIVSPDYDHDGNRKELDPDNDHAQNDGANDGCEDANQNGIYEPELDESSNFNAAQENDCHGILFLDDFNDGNADGWTIMGEGTWSAGSGALCMHMGNEPELNEYALAGNSAWTDYTFDVDVVAMTSMISADKIVVFRSDANGSGYQVNVRGWKWQDIFLWQEPGGTLQTHPYSNTNGTWYHIKVTVHGSHIQVWVNSALQFDYTASTPIPNGLVGLRGHSGGTYGEGEDVCFDNVVVSR